MKKLMFAAVVAGALLAAASAGADVPDGGGGGATAPQPPLVESVSCLASPSASCPAKRKLLRGRAFVVRGQGLATTEQIVFAGRKGRDDDAVVTPERITARYATGTVPDEARSGPLVVRDRHGYSASSASRVTVATAPTPAPVDLAPGSRYFFAGRRKPAFTFEVNQAVSAQVELVSEESGLVVRSWQVGAAPGDPGNVTWDGADESGAPAPGSYHFRLAGQAAAAVTSASSGDAFYFADHLFPIRGRHNLGYTATNNFGGGRNHRGQDMFARCGTRLAAARGGRVQYAGYHAAAGYYAVIDGTETGMDYVYMHMLAPALVTTGERVFTGQKIGEVGETGRATGCHLHFELWSAPGWYEGGRAFDPLPTLKVWDSYS